MWVYFMVNVRKVWDLNWCLFVECLFNMGVVYIGFVVFFGGQFVYGYGNGNMI